MDYKLNGQHIENWQEAIKALENLNGFLDQSEITLEDLYDWLDKRDGARGLKSIALFDHFLNSVPFSSVNNVIAWNPGKGDIIFTESDVQNHGYNNWEALIDEDILEFLIEDGALIPVGSPIEMIKYQINLDGFNSFLHRIIDDSDLRDDVMNHLEEVPKHQIAPEHLPGFLALQKFVKHSQVGYYYTDLQQLFGFEEMRKSKKVKITR